MSSQPNTAPSAASQPASASHSSHSSVCLYLQRLPLAEPLTLGLLRRWLGTAPAVPRWISLDPRPHLLARPDGGLRLGRLSGLQPLAQLLPADTSLDALPLLAASVYEAQRWLHWHAAHPLSDTPGQILIWSTCAPEAAADPSPAGTTTETLPGLHCRSQKVLPWQDRQRFGLDDAASAPTGPDNSPDPHPNPAAPTQVPGAALHTEHFYQGGQRLTWRILPPETGAST